MFSVIIPSNYQKKKKKPKKMKNTWHERWWMSLVKGRVYRFSWGISLARIERATSSTRTFLFTRNSSLLLTPVDDDATAGSVLENEKWNKVTVYFLIQSCVVRTYFLEHFRVFEWKIVVFFSFFFFSFLREYLNWSNRRIYIYIYRKLIRMRLIF